MQTSQVLHGGCMLSNSISGAHIQWQGYDGVVFEL